MFDTSDGGINSCEYMSSKIYTTHLPPLFNLISILALHCSHVSCHLLIFFPSLIVCHLRVFLQINNFLHMILVFVSYWKVLFHVPNYPFGISFIKIICFFNKIELYSYVSHWWLIELILTPFISIQISISSFTSSRTPFFSTISSSFSSIIASINKGLWTNKCSFMIFRIS